MMSKVLIAAIVCGLSLGGVSWAFETAPLAENQAGYSPWPNIKPSGLRFAEPTMSVQTGGFEGGMAGVSGTPCGACGNGGGLGPCIYWTLMPWYGSWSGTGHHRGAACHCGSVIVY
jgi:hypothetical protein